MSTTRILLDPTTAILPTSNPATLSSVTTSGGTPPSNAPAVSYKILQFNDSTDQTAIWNFPILADYVSGGTVAVQWYAAATTGAVIWKAGICPVTLNSVDLDTSSAYNAADLSATVTVPGTSGKVLETSWALTVTNVTAGVPVSLFIGRRAAAAGDTAVGNANLFTARLEYTS